MLNSRYPTSRTGARLVSIIISFSLLVCFPKQSRFFQTRVQAQAQTIIFDAAAGNSGTYTAISAGGALGWIHPVGTGANRILIVSISTNGPPSSTNRVTSVTFNGTSLSRIGTVISADQQSAVEMFELLSPPSGAGHSVFVNISPPTTYVVGGSVSFSGVNQSSPLRTQRSGLMATNSGTFQPSRLLASSSANVSVISGSSDVVVDT